MNGSGSVVPKSNYQIKKKVEIKHLPYQLRICVGNKLSIIFKNI